jgi:4-hydroxythreonine-4-phosphate dehydrogenase
MSDTRQPRLAITLGDPAGIGTEVVLKALAPLSFNYDVTIVGNRSLLHQIYERLRSAQPQIPLANPDQLPILDVTLGCEADIVMGRESAASGATSFHYLDTAIAHALNGKFDGIVTAPIAKSAWKAAGHEYPGQTELLAEKAGVDRFGMLFVARSPHTDWTLRTLLATTHISLRSVADSLTPDLMTRKLDLLVECLQQDFGLATPRIAIAGLNPHSGEQGQLGREEQEWLFGWLEQSRDRLPHVQLDGLIPPDTLWVKPGQAWYRTNAVATAHDAYLALYHDQGLIPVKLLAFDRAVNTSIGLPFVRTSPDHGTAFDIADRGIADATSMKTAIQLAIELCQQRYSWGNPQPNLAFD